MSSLDRLTLELARTTERVFGKRAAARQYRSISKGLPMGEQRQSAVLAWLRCAIAAHEFASVDAAIEAWPDAGVEAEVVVEIRERCRELFGIDRKDAARRLAEAEDQRLPSVVSGFALARYSEAVSHPSAHLYQRTLDRVAESGSQGKHTAIEAAARWGLQRAQAFSTTSSPVGVPTPGSTPSDRLAHGASALASAGRYGRVSALDTFLELLGHEDVSVRDWALRLTARHVDRIGQRLTAIETDRVSEIFRVGNALAALERMASVEARGSGWQQRHEERVATALDTKAPLSAPMDAASLEERLAFAAADIAVRSAIDAPLGERAEELSVLVNESVSVLGPEWAAAEALLSSAEARERTQGRVLLEGLLKKPGREPLAGFTALASACERASSASDTDRASLRELEEKVLERAVLAGEARLRSRLGDMLRRRAWQLHAQRQSRAALNTMRRAKTLLGGRS